jgi:putative acetyltransferase
MRIEQADRRDSALVALLRDHHAEMAAVSPPESCHVLDPGALAAPDIVVWAARDGEAIAGCAALKELESTHGEIKSMRTALDYRRRGVGSRLLAHLIAVARLRGYRRLSLETGSQPFFRPARALYLAHGFRYCEPFGDYRPDPQSVFMTLDPANPPHRPLDFDPP